MWGTVRPNLWRMAVAISFLASVARSGPARFMLPAVVWYALQFGALAVAIVLLLPRRHLTMRTIDWGIVTFLGIYAFCALFTTVTGLLPRHTLAQAGLLILMFAFLGLTFATRWVTPDTIRGDLLLGFALICGAQATGLAGLVAGQAWPVADYGRFQGVFTDANYAGILAATAIMIGAYLIGSQKRGPLLWLIILGLLGLGIALGLSGARGALLALGLGAVSLVLVRASRRIIAAFAAVVIALGAAALIAVPKLGPSWAGAFSRTLQGSDVTSGRLKIYGEVLARWSHMPWFGTGYRTTEVLTGGRASHNIYLSVLAETGVFGAAVFAILLLLILRGGPRSGGQRWLLGAVVTILAIELTESTLFGWGGPNAMVAWLTLLAFAASGRVASPGATAAGLGRAVGAEAPAFTHRLRAFASRISS